ncbi:hypothetical protein [Glutamicibacter sp. PS]|uniref:hypothetical protein n=1 Tax=Glutamicibacter sp. PS TaxID=3075634 RepID=UPI00284E7826|nr:hypothetical protein [Glutamicibacter sp. PS]MDR4533217.1 hypothetical protein [Glutamicibacter sp. PS]
MSPYIGQSKVLMDLDETVASSLVANRTLAKVPKGASAATIDKIWDRHFGEPEDDEADGADESSQLEKPRGNDSRQKWADYAINIGISEDSLAGKKQGEIRELVDAVMANVSEKLEQKQAGSDETEGSTGDGDSAQGDHGGTENQ